MNSDQLRKHAECSNCNNPIGNTGLPLFWTIKIERHGVKVDKVAQHDAIATILGGSQVLASAMGPNDNLTESMLGPIEITLCEHCAASDINIMQLAMASE